MLTFLTDNAVLIAFTFGLAIGLWWGRKQGRIAYHRDLEAEMEARMNQPWVPNSEPVKAEQPGLVAVPDGR